MSQGGANGDTVLVYPSKIDPHCEALVFVLSASDSDVSTMNLATPDALQFTGHSAGEKTSSLFIKCPTTLAFSKSPCALLLHTYSTGAHNYGIASQRLLRQQMPVDHTLHSCCILTFC